MCAALKRRIDQEIESGAIDENVIHFYNCIAMLRLLRHRRTRHQRADCREEEAEATYAPSEPRQINIDIFLFHFFSLGFVFASNESHRREFDYNRQTYRQCVITLICATVFV